MSVRADVDRRLELTRRLEEIEAEVKEIDARLEKAALLGEQVELEDADREGRQFWARGSSQEVPVVLTADLLVRSFAADSAVHLRIDAAARGKLLSFFTPKKTFSSAFENGKVFRREAAVILGAQAPEFISACLQRDKSGIPKSQIRIEWDRAREIGS